MYFFSQERSPHQRTNRVIQEQTERPFDKCNALRTLKTPLKSMKCPRKNWMPQNVYNALTIVIHLVQIHDRIFDLTLFGMGFLMYVKHMER